MKKSLNAKKILISEKNKLKKIIEKKNYQKNKITYIKILSKLIKIQKFIKEKILKKITSI